MGREPAGTDRRVKAGGGFTLVEVLVVLGLLAFLSIIAVVNFTGWRNSENLQQGAWRTESLLRMARADAANTGRRIRLTFDADSRQMRLLWEPDPLGQPQQFLDYSACTWADFIPAGLVRVERCRLSGPGDYQTLGAERMGAGADEATLEAVTFHPDGSSDSAVIELTALGVQDDRRAVIELDGLSGAVTTRIMTPTEWQEYQQQGF